MKKRFFLILIGLACVAALSACDGNDGGSSSQATPEDPSPPPAPADSWRPMARNPQWNSTFHPRGVSVVWTGGEMILWGSLTGSTLMTGGLYDPLADQWSAISTVNAPGPGPAVWTGAEMIVCTGYETMAYSPATDSWRSASAVNQPQTAASPLAVWTGTEMIVWGRLSAFPGLSVGGRYNPVTDSWSAVSSIGAPPSYPVAQAAVWTGSKMIVWTGLGGSAYDPATDTWSTLAGLNAPADRFNHLAVWTGSEMIVWGGQIQVSSFILPVQSGRRYNPSTDFWSFMATTGSVWAKTEDAAVWTGEEMLLWTAGGGAAYDPAIDAWRSISGAGAPTGSGPAVWTGTEMLVWTGETGARYTP